MGRVMSLAGLRSFERFDPMVTLASQFVGRDSQMNLCIAVDERASLVEVTATWAARESCP